MSEIEAKLETRKLNDGETPQELSKNGFDIGAQQYLDWTCSLENIREEWLGKLFNRLYEAGTIDLSKAKMVDLGCGSGWPATAKLAQKCGHTTGIEISSKQLELAATRFKQSGISEDKYKLIEADMLTVDFEQDSLDAVCAFYSIIQLHLADQHILLKRIHSWLRKSGLLLFNVAAQESAADGEVMVDWLGIEGMNVYWASFGQKKIQELLEDIGFEIVETEEIEVEGDADFTWIIAKKPA